MSRLVRSWRGLHDQYSSASIIVMTRSVTRASDGSGEWCLGRGCNHFRILDVSAYSDDVPVPSFGLRVQCNQPQLADRRRDQRGRLLSVASPISEHFEHPPSFGLVGDAINDAVPIFAEQHRTIMCECNIDWASPNVILTGREAHDKILILPSRLAGFEWQTEYLVSGVQRAVPRAVERDECIPLPSRRKLFTRIERDPKRR